MTPRVAWALVAATVVAGALVLAAARRRQWLDHGALPAAAAVGLAIVFGTGVGGSLLLVAFLVSTSLLTRFRGSRKAGDGLEHAARSGGRVARQVWANGGIAALCAVLAATPGMEVLAAGVAGALATATADTWATEVGTAVRGRTVLVTSLRDVEPGTSGGVSAAGTAAGLCGSVMAGILVATVPHLWDVPWLHRAGAWPAPDAAATAGAVIALAGVAGMLADSLLGAIIEDRRPWLDNDVVNLLATAGGAAIAIVLTRACMPGVPGP